MDRISISNIQYPTRNIQFSGRVTAMECPTVPRIRRTHEEKISV